MYYTHVKVGLFENVILSLKVTENETGLEPKLGVPVN